MPRINVLDPAGEAKDLLKFCIARASENDVLIKRTSDGNVLSEDSALEVDSIIDNIIAAAVAEVENRQEKEQPDPDAEGKIFIVCGKGQHDPPVTIVKSHVTHMRETLARQHRIIYLSSGQEITTWSSANTIKKALDW